jgi:hypothetical protein
MRIPEISKGKKEGELLAAFIANSSGLDNGFRKKRHWPRIFIKRTKKEIKFFNRLPSLKIG